MEIVKWICSFLLMMSGMWIAWQLPNFEFAFVGFLMGHTIMFFVLYRMKEWAMFTSNTVFWIIDAGGVYTWLL